MNATNRKQRRTVPTRLLETARDLLPSIALALTAAAIVLAGRYGPDPDREAARRALGQAEIGYTGNRNIPKEEKAFLHTVALAEESRARNGAAWKPPQGPSIRLHLYRNREELQERLNLPGAKGYSAYRDGAVTVSLPVKQPSGLWPDRGFRRLVNHEMHHAALMQRLGPEAWRRIPVWFYEGTATDQEAQGAGRIWLLTENALQIARARNLDQYATQFCRTAEYPLKYHADAVFLRHIEYRRPGISERLIRAVEQGYGFHQTFEEELGESCEEAFARKFASLPEANRK